MPCGTLCVKCGSPETSPRYVVHVSRESQANLLEGVSCFVGALEYGIDAQYSGFTPVDFEAGGDWTLDGVGHFP